MTDIKDLKKKGSIHIKMNGLFRQWDNIRNLNVNKIIYLLINRFNEETTILWFQNWKRWSWRLGLY